MTGLIQRFERNTVGRDWIVGDIHGYFTRLQHALEQIGFAPETDRLFSVGDLVDRGPESHLVLEWLDKPWFHPVQGNHETMAVEWGLKPALVDKWLYASNGGAWNIGNLPDERATYAHALAALPLAIEIETEQGLVGVVHAEPTYDWAELRADLQDPWLDGGDLERLRERLQWERHRLQYRDRHGVRGLRAAVVGHTPLYAVVKLGNVHFIDTGAWHDEGLGFTFMNAATLEHVTVPLPKDEPAAGR